jgi:PhoH-like ATPase
LSYLVEKLKGEDIAGHVTLVKGERSRVAELGARLL